jgi:hypothetical protein
MNVISLGLVALILLPLCASAAELDGLYFMTRFRPGATGKLETATYRFHDGEVARDPIGIVEGNDIAAERVSRPGSFGTYIWEGDELTVALGGRGIKAKFERRANGCFAWNGGSFCPVEPFQSGAVLDGTFSSGSEGASDGAPISRSVITFRPDGTYGRESNGSFATDDPTATAAGSAEQGRYRIDGTALHLTTARGKESSVSTFQHNDGTKGPAPRRIYIGGVLLKRDNGRPRDK